MNGQSSNDDSFIDPIRSELVVFPDPYPVNRERPRIRVLHPDFLRQYEAAEGRLIGDELIQKATLGPNEAPSPSWTELHDEEGQFLCYMDSRVVHIGDFN